MTTSPIINRVLWVLARVVPRADRVIWQQEWQAELCWLTERRPSRVQLARRLASAARHACWLRWHQGRVEMLADDLRHGLRALRRRPGYLLATVLTLGLGIGASTAVFSAAHAVLWRALPFPDAHQLVMVSSTLMDAPDAVSPGSASPPDFADWRAMSGAFDGLAAISEGGVSLVAGANAERVTGASVTGDFFPLLKIAPLQGRLLQQIDDPVGAPPVAVISDALWARLLNRDPEALGSTITVEGVPHQLVGIVPAALALPLDAEVWTPLRFTEQTLQTQRGAHYLTVVGRLAPGVGLDAARADMRRVTATIRETLTTESTASVVNLRDAFVGDVRPTFWLLLAAVGILLLVASVNVASLVVAQTSARRQDYAVRVALGASRQRLMRAQLAESGIVGVLGCLAGLVIASASSRLIRGFDDVAVPRLAESQIDWPVTLFAVAVTVGATCVVGIWPAWRLSRLREGMTGRRVLGTRATSRARKILVTAEIGMAVTLLIGAGLIGRSFLQMVNVDLGLDAPNVQTGSLSLPEAAYPPERRVSFVDTLLTSLAGQPGIDASAVVFGLPLSGFNYYISGYERDGVRVSQDDWTRSAVQVRVVGGDYFRALGIPIVEGRAFSDNDRRNQPPTIVINRSAAELLWPGERAIDRTFTVGTRLGLGGLRAGGTVIGVSTDVRDLGPAVAARPTIFLNYRQFPIDEMTLVVRGAGTMPTAAALQGAVRSLDPTVPLYRLRSMDRLRSRVVAEPRLYLSLIGLFALAAVGLAAVGIYGVLSQVVGSQTREIGVRLALGASRGRVAWQVTRQATTLAVIGIVAGSLLALAAGRLIATVLHGVTPTDPLTFALVAAVALTVTLAAAWLPSRRAASIDPARALQID
jgi:predicted permease